MSKETRYRNVMHHRQYPLDQGWANYGPRAKYGPLRGSMRPAEGLENAKKNEVSKNMCEHNKTFKNEGGIMERERRDLHFPHCLLFRSPSTTCLLLRFIIVY
jgi:hypothetical protein